VIEIAKRLFVVLKAKGELLRGLAVSCSSVWLRVRGVWRSFEIERGGLCLGELFAVLVWRVAIIIQYIGFRQRFLQILFSLRMGEAEDSAIM